MTRRGALPAVDRSPGRPGPTGSRCCCSAWSCSAVAASGSRADRMVIDQQVGDFAADNAWFWPAVAVAAAILGLLSLRRLFLQTTGTKVGRLHLESDRAHGTTAVSAGAVADAVTEEVRGYRGVDRADAEVRGGAPEMVLTAALDGRVPAGAVTARLLDDAVPHTRQALDRPDLPVRVQLRLASRSRRDLR